MVGYAAPMLQTPTTRSGRSRLRAVAALATVAAAVPVVGGVATAGAAQPTATASKSCGSSLPKYPGVGYFTSLKVYGLSCSSGKKVMLAHYRCRVKHGKAGKCGSVSGYRCSERRFMGPTEYDARVTCKKGSKKVVYTYSQDR